MATSPLENFLILPNEESKILLHSCCAVCCGSIIKRLVASKIKCTIFYYNPNISPKEEYEIRKQEQVRYAKKLNIPFVDADYDIDNWKEKIQGLEKEPERGRRCSVCFDLRFEKTALYAYKHGFNVFTSTLSLSRWKDFEQVIESGKKAALKYPGLIYWDYNWRKKGGSHMMYEIAKEENFYKQEYCGCLFSLQSKKNCE